MEQYPTSLTSSSGRVLVISDLLDSWLIFYAKTLTRTGYDVTLVTNLDPSVKEHDHGDVLKYFRATPFCHVIDIKDATELSRTRYDFAIAGLKGPSPLNEKRRLRAAIGSIPLQAVVLRRYGTRFADLGRIIAKEMLYPFVRRSPRVLVETYRDCSWMLQLLSSTSRMGVVPHQRTTCQGLPEGLADQTERKYLFNFLGSYSSEPPTDRTRIIDHLEAHFGISGGVNELTIGGKIFSIIWHADRPTSKRERPLNEYLNTLSNSFFTLCLPGYTVTTHRVWEAIICGSIPVLKAQLAHHYGLPFKHGRNCWLVKDTDWESALMALSALDQKQIFEMQSTVKDLARREASVPSLEKKCLRLLGLNHS